MSSILEACNLTQEEQDEVFQQFTGGLDCEEEANFSKKFRQYCFYDTWGTQNYRDCICTNCGAFSVYKDEEPEFFKGKHNDELRCPNCGEKVTLYSLGRMKTGSSLTEYQRAAFIRPAKDGGILLTAGYGQKEYNPWDLRPGVCWYEKSLTYLLRENGCSGEKNCAAIGINAGNRQCRTGSRRRK